MVIKSVSISVPRTVEVGRVVTVRIGVSIDVSEIPSSYSRYRLITDLVVDGKVYESKVEAITPIRSDYDVYVDWKPVEVGTHRVKAVAKVVVLPPPLPIEFLGQSVDVVRRAAVIDERSSEEIEVRVVGPRVPTPFAAPKGVILWIDLPSEVPPGKRIAARIAVKNVGSEPGRFNVTLVVEGASYTKSVALGPGEDRVVEIGFDAPSDPGTYRVVARVVNSLTGSIDDCRRVVMVVAKPSSASSTSAPPVAVIASVYAPRSVAAGERTVIRVKIANTCDREFDGEVRLMSASGEVMGTASVKVGPGETVEKAIEFVAPSEPGTYVLYIELVRSSDGEVVDSKTVTISVGAAPKTGTAPVIPRARIVNVEAPEKVVPGQRFAIKVTVENASPAEFTGYLWIKMNENVVYSTDLVLPGRGSKTVTVEIESPREPGRYVYEVDVYNEYTASIDDSRKVVVEVVGEEMKERKAPAEKRAAARIESVDHPSIVAPGERFEVKVAVVGGSELARCLVEAAMGGKVMDVKYVVVLPGERKVVALTCVAPIRPGRYAFNAILLDAYGYEVIDERSFEVEVSASREIRGKVVGKEALSTVKRLFVPLGIASGVAIAIAVPILAKRRS